MLLRACLMEHPSIDWIVKLPAVLPESVTGLRRRKTKVTGMAHEGQ